MAYWINMKTCSSCGDCEPKCPVHAISHRDKVYAIDPKKCNDCKGSSAKPRCVEVCKPGAVLAG